MSSGAGTMAEQVRAALHALRRASADHRRPRSLREAVAGRVVLITGSSSGIGRAAAVRMGAAGATVVLVARRRERLEEAGREVEAAGGVADLHACDLSSPEAIDRMAAEVLGRHGRVDILVNNAGRSIRRAVGDSYDRLHDFERTMQLNYVGAVGLILDLLPGMRERGFGHIVNVSTAGVQTSAPLFSAYLASKAALDAFSRSLSFEVAADGVAVTTINMPLVRTPMIAPTRMYDSWPALSPEQAADLVCEAIRRRPRRVATALGTLGQLAYAVAPDLDQRVNAAIGRLRRGWRGRGLRPRLATADGRPGGDGAAWRESFRRHLESSEPGTDPAEVEALAGLLGRVPLFDACTRGELRRLASTAYPIAFEEGEVLCREGAESADCFVVADGEALVSIAGRAAGAVHSGEVVGERGPVEGLPRAATVTASTRLLAYAIARARLEEVIATNPAAAAHMRRLVRARYQQPAPPPRAEPARTR